MKSFLRKEGDQGSECHDNLMIGMHQQVGRSFLLASFLHGGTLYPSAVVFMRLDVSQRVSHSQIHGALESAYMHISLMMLHSFKQNPLWADYKNTMGKLNEMQALEDREGGTLVRIVCSGYSM